jgi:hypothetical protein
MIGFNRGRSSDGCILGIEIGSASVAMAIMSSPHTGAPKIYWHKREFVQIGEGTDLENREKRVINVLINMLLALGTTGLKVLRDDYPDETVTDITVSISAPWAYTTLHYIKYTQPKLFSVTEPLIKNLSTSATERILETILSEPTIQGSALTPIDLSTVGVLVNDYLITEYNGGNKTDTLTLLQSSSIADERIVTVATDNIEKILPLATLQFTSFMSALYEHVHRKFPLLKEYMLIDITSEATELGVIRDGVLAHTSHILFGSYSIARELAAVLAISHEEAHSYLQLDHAEIAALPEKSRAVLSTVLAEYQAQLNELFNNTGDELLVPESLFLLCDTELTSVLANTVSTEAMAVTSSHHTIHPITPEVIGSPITDVAVYITTARARTCSTNH